MSASLVVALCRARASTERTVVHMSSCREEKFLRDGECKVRQQEECNVRRAHSAAPPASIMCCPH